MKGIAHFAIGIAVSTFFPQIVHDAAQGLAFGPVLAGIAGLLPDTLDFKLLRYFERPDEVIDPAHLTPPATGAPDPASAGAPMGAPLAAPLAARIAAAANRAHDTGRPVRVQLHTLRLGGDLWRRWSVAFDTDGGQIRVHVGPAVTTAQVPMPGSEPPAPATGSAPVRAPLRYPAGDEIVVDIFNGPSLTFEPGEGGVEVVFLPWHRAWTHSLLMALLLGLAGCLVAPVCGLAMALAVLAHAAIDQLGFMGSNLLYPWTRRRARGLGLFHSGEALPNFLAVWTSLALILLNLDRFSAQPVLPPGPYLLLAVVLPAAVLLAASSRRGSGAATAATEALEEAADPEL
ncbi:MAG: metal-dependent hydrolase [Anaerolineae bacterium]